MSFLRDYLLPGGKRAELWEPYNRALIPLFVAIAPFLLLDFAFGMHTIPWSPLFWLALSVGTLLSFYVCLIGVMPWAQRITGKRKKDGRES